MKNRLILLFVFFFFVIGRANAAIESVTASLSGTLNAPLAVNAGLVLEDQWYPFPSGWNSIFRVKESKANMVLRYDDSRRTYTDKRWQLDVTYNIITWDAAGTQTNYTGQSLQITYDPREGINYVDRDMKEYSNAHRASFFITGLTLTQWSPASSSSSTTSSTIPSWLNDIYLDLEIHTERYYNLSTSSVPTMTLTENTTTNELDITWNYVQGAESYDLEWLFVDVGDATAPFVSNYNYDWKNASRVNVPDQHYSVALAYPKGILLVRVRGVGIDWDNYVNNALITRGEADWTWPTNTGGTSSYASYRYDVGTGLLPEMNWAYSAGFAEDGKRMDGAEFYDGMMRGREAISTVNSTNQVIVGTGGYDFEGRGAVSFLPYPEANNGIKFYGGNQDYARENYDSDGKVYSPNAMSTSNGSGEYYSSSTSAQGMDGQQASAGGYPYSRVTYMSDGTNRPATSTGVGADLKSGSGRETQYFYATPTQNQLDRLFGNEVGYATHYKKNFVIDANGVVSVAYIDQHGRVVATALAGEAPANLEAIDNPNGNPNSSVDMTDDLLGNNHLRTSGDGYQTEFTLAVTETSVHDFVYTLGSSAYTGTCYTSAEASKYDLEIMVFDRNGDSIDVNTASSTEYAQRYSNLSAGTYTFSLNLTPGTYRVTKKLTLNHANLDALRQTYLAYAADPAHQNDPNCIPFITPDPVPCPADCHDACVQHYFVNGVYVDDSGTALEDQGAGEDDPGPQLIAACQHNLCDQPKTDDPCELKRKAMLYDMSPGGQYFDNLPSHFSVDAGTGLQSINASYYTVGNHSGDINNWLEDQPFSSTMLSDINAVWTGTDFTSWDAVRDNWDASWAELLLPYHPEYCAWNYHCSWTCEYETATAGTVTVGSSESFDYEMATMYSTIGDFNTAANDRFFWNPLDMDGDSTNSPTSANSGYLPYGNNNTSHMDPRFAGDCDITICESPNTSAQITIQNQLQNFFPAYNSSNAFIGYYSVWYVALDPDNIAGGSYDSYLSTETVALFDQLHDASTGLISATPAAGQITPYQFFRAVYFYYRTLAIEQGFVGDDNVATCQSQHISGGTSFPAYDAQGYLAGSTSNPVVTSEGFTILYQHNPLIDIYGDGCDNPTAAELATILGETVEAGSANPNEINNVVPTSNGCSCQMLTDFYTSRGLVDISGNPIAADIAAALNEEYDPATDYTASDVTGWLNSCEENTALINFPEALACNLDIEIADANQANQDNCEQENLDLAVYNAYIMYQNQLNAAADAYMEAYINNCLNSANELFTVNYDLHEYYYTLYYYDQAGNLVKTVPPEGVNIIDLANGDLDGDGEEDGIEIKTYRNDFRDGTITPAMSFTPAEHDMKSVYAYNSLQQPVKAKQNNTGNGSVYESGETSFWYDYLGRLVVSQNSRQKDLSPQAYSYTLYDDLGRVYEVGEIHTASTLTADATGSRDHNASYYYYEISGATALESWLATGTKNDVTYTYYDEAMPGTGSDVTNAFPNATQYNLRNRVSAVVYDDDPSSVHNLYGFTVSGQAGHLSAFYYSYDVHGNAKAVVQETPPLKTHNQQVKTTTYEYDLISGNVNAVHYQSGQRDEFHHRYEYDADNRMHASYSSRDGKTWEKESKQFYYEMGGMGRMELGDKTVQGLDYVYTINGWIKGLNRNTIGNYGQYMERDLGQDGQSSNTNRNKNIGADAAGFVLDYYAGDYTAINSSTAFQAASSGTAYGTAIKAQYNGNIAGMSTSMLDNNQTAAEIQGRAFSYDQLYRIKQSLAFHMNSTALSGNAWQSSYTQDNRYREDFTYDWNGNIKTVKRYTGNLVSGTAVKSDDLIYHYVDNSSGADDENSNQLDWIEDLGASACAYEDDLDNQSSYLSGNVNYTYNKNGDLIADNSERITDIEWNPYGKMKAVHKDPTNNTNACTSTEYSDADVEYLYTPAQQRLCKIVKPHKAGGGISDQDQWEYTWYVYDAGGMVMAVYKQSFEDYTAGGNTHKVHFDVEEHDVYGSGRLGIRHGDEDGKYYQDWNAFMNFGMFSNVSVTGSSAAYSKTHYNREIGTKQYELSNHLGNVLVTVTDKRMVYSATPSTATTVDWYTADVVSYTDYYAFGAPETGRSGGDGYRYGFNGMESDPEMKGQGAHYTTEYRQYDARVGRWFSVDPIVKPWESPYAGYANNPIYFKDPSGLNPGGPKQETVQKGEGPAAVAARAGITLDQLAQWNPDVFTNYDPNNPDYWKDLSGTNWNIDPGQMLNVSASASGDQESWESDPYAENPINEQGGPVATEGIRFEEQSSSEAMAAVAPGLVLRGGIAAGADGPLPIGEVAAAVGIAIGLGIAAARTNIEVTHTTVYEPPPLLYVTYTKYNPTTGQTYVGRTMGYGNPYNIVAARDASHHKTAEGFGPAVLDVYVAATLPFAARNTDPAYQSIRGREQIMINSFGGSWSANGGNTLTTCSGNAINGISLINPLYLIYMSAGYATFGSGTGSPVCNPSQ